jgi:RimJ/RimL family protein N-acetyltransferase
MPPEPTPPLRSARLVLEPLRVEHADELVQVLADPALYTFIGGEPPTLDRLRDRFGRMLAGSGGPQEQWHNWILRLDGAAGAAIGTVQATVVGESGAGSGAGSGFRAEVAWVLGTRWQGRGYAAEAAAALVDWLRGLPVAAVAAHIHPDHAASEAVARRISLVGTGRFDQDGEQLWQLAAGSDSSGPDSSGPNWSGPASSGPASSGPASSGRDSSGRESSDPESSGAGAG